jgi:hypothetical protein
MTRYAYGFLRRPFRDLTTADVDAWVERDHERQLARYEREVDEADARREAYERELEDEA